tara:strand:- start:5778 stop:6371 length:594 start_codon:yes stop_codon:yes gene_type:complete
MIFNILHKKHYKYIAEGKSFTILKHNEIYYFSKTILNIKCINSNLKIVVENSLLETTIITLNNYYFDNNYKNGKIYYKIDKFYLSASTNYDPYFPPQTIKPEEQWKPTTLTAKELYDNSYNNWILLKDKYNSKPEHDDGFNIKLNGQSVEAAAAEVPRQGEGNASAQRMKFISAMAQTLVSDTIVKATRSIRKRRRN